MTSEKRIFNLTRRTQREENEWKKNLRASCFVFAVQVFTKVWRPSWRLRFCFLFFFSIVRFAELSVGFPPFFSFCCRFTGEGGACRLGGPGWQPIKRSQKRTESVLQKNLKKKNQNKTRTFGPARLVAFHVLASFFFLFFFPRNSDGVGRTTTNKQTKIEQKNQDSSFVAEGPGRWIRVWLLFVVGGFCSFRFPIFCFAPLRVFVCLAAIGCVFAARLHLQCWRKKFEIRTSSWFALLAIESVENWICNQMEKKKIWGRRDEQEKRIKREKSRKLEPIFFSFIFFCFFFVTFCLSNEHEPRTELVSSFPCWFRSFLFLFSARGRRSPKRFPPASTDGVDRRRWGISVYVCVSTLFFLFLKKKRKKAQTAAVATNEQQEDQTTTARFFFTVSFRVFFCGCVCVCFSFDQVHFAGWFFFVFFSFRKVFSSTARVRRRTGKCRDRDTKKNTHTPHTKKKNDADGATQF